MSTSTSNALGSADGSGSAFAQQGSLDWVALGRTQYSVSIAILGRLAKAGIDTLTIAFGQAMCLKIPIGPHGEKVLANSMSRLTAKSCAADLIWFGVGVRHILRELAQTSQGCSLIALCAALTEAHSIAVSALVLYEIGKACGGPQELAPSLEQWEALIRVSASVFNGTTFGLRISQIAKFGTLHHGQTMKNSPNPHPSDLAKLLLSIGQIVNGSLQSISVQGGRCCSWIASWADFVLGLRVLVRDAHGKIAYANYNAEETFAQVDISFLADGDSGRVLCVQSSHLLRSGTEFIQKCFGRHRLALSMSPDLLFCPGGLQWETMFSDMFGAHFGVLMTGKNGTQNPSQPFPRREGSPHEVVLKNGFLVPSVILSEDQIFSRLLAIAIIVMVVKGIPNSHGSANRYFVRASERFPELRQCNEQTLFAIRNFVMLYSSEESMLDCQTLSDTPSLQGLILEFRDYSERLRALCNCRDHQHNDSSKDIVSQICLWRLTTMIFQMISLFDRVILDTPLRPTIYGLHHLYETMSASHNDSRPDSLFDQITRFPNDDWNAAFSALAAIFSAEDWDFEPPGVVARSDGKIYCYTQLLEGLTDSIQDASKIHIGSGQIEYGTRLYRALYDTNGQPESSFGYSAQHAEVIDTIGCLDFDTTSNPIEAQVVVEEEPTHLCIRHRISTDSGDMFVAPTVFYERLQKATLYKCSNRLPTSAYERWMPVLRGHQYILVRGEGLVDRSDRCHMLRPLRGNVLGRCVALSRTKGPVALVKSDEELGLFARSWANYRDNCLESTRTYDYVVLIS